MTGVLPAEQTKELGQILVRQGLLTTGGLARALNHQKQTGQPLGRVLVDLELVGEEDVTRARAEQVDIAYVRMADVAIDPAVLSLVSANVAHKYLLLPVGRTPDGTLKIIVAAWNARLIAVAAKIAAAHRLQIAPALASEGPLRLALEQYYGLLPLTGGSALPAIVAPIAPRASDLFSGRGTMVARSTALSLARPEEIHETGGDQPVVIQFVNRILTAAVQRGASDIHFEPRRDALEIRFRLDGTLQHVDSVPREYQAACASRLKILAEMNIAERRLPQDGRIGVTVEGRSIDMRVSSLPTQHGEAVVLRILDKNGVRLGLEQLGFSERNLRVLQSLIRKPHGIFLVTGPTGSGKTTTLYSALQAIHTPDVNVITVEDPIEYELEGIRQSSINEKAGLTFARQLRAILRQDPDVIYVGEIRDAETAEIAFRAALTGHLVFSTLHCNDAAGAITRLLNMNVDPFLVASSIVGVLAQRLVRRVCARCARRATPSALDLTAFGVDVHSPDYARARFLAGAGCEVCGQTGYKGRYSVQELMVMDDDIRALTLSRAPAMRIRQAAIARGMVPMRQDAAAKVMQGLSTFEEAQKRVYLEEEPSAARLESAGETG